KLVKLHSDIIFQDFLTEGKLRIFNRCQLVNIVSHMTEIHGLALTVFSFFYIEGEFPPAIISLCPILRDPFSTKGYINQDFGLLFNAETSNKLLERWETAFKQKIFNEAQSLTSTAEIGVFSMQQVDKDLKMVGIICEDVKISYLLWLLVVVSTKCFFFVFLNRPQPPKHLLIQIGTVTCHLSSCSCISCSREEEDQDQSNRGC
uniref:Uncharacterized protein n=1 Tax=Cyprinus carpio carpio TaxID=630221 RepID=A0A9J7Z4Q0_CYPCA